MKLVNLTNINQVEGREIYISESIVKDVDAVRDITLTLENNYNTVKQLESYFTTLEKKINKGCFDYGLALKGIKAILDRNIKSEYLQKYCNTSRIDSLLCVEDRIYIYIYFLEEMIEDIREELFN